jgi:uncharacterized protein YbjQ (UPF0145 family)
MRKIVSSAIILGAVLAASVPAHARDTRHMLPVASAMEAKDAQEKLDGSVKFYFGDQQTPKVLAQFGDEVSNRKTNAFGKADVTACNWAFLSALVAFEKKAKALGANAVVNIRSFYKKNEVSSQTEFECHAGAVMAGVALKGDFVRIGDN